MKFVRIDEGGDAIPISGKVKQIYNNLWKKSILKCATLASMTCSGSTTTTSRTAVTA
jgi:hypothetical protein